jgi:hypothetical protein
MAALSFINRPFQRRPIRLTVVIAFTCIVLFVLLSHIGRHPSQSPTSAWSFTKQSLVSPFSRTEAELSRNFQVEVANTHLRSGKAPEFDSDNVSWASKEFVPGLVSLETTQYARVSFDDKIWIFQCQAKRETIVLISSFMINSRLSLQRQEKQ